MNTQLNRELYALLNNTGLMEQKESLVIAFSNGREESTKGLTEKEAGELIAYLRRQPNPQDQAADKMRKKIISMAHELGWHNLVNGKWVIDMRSIDTWCLRYGYLKKEFNKYTVEELPMLVTQFQKVYEGHLSKI